MTAVANTCVSQEAVHCKWRCDKACTASHVWCFCKTKVPRLFSFSPEGARKWEVKVVNSYLLLVKCWYLQHFRSVVIEVEEGALGTGAEQGFFIIFNAACLRCKKKPRNIVGHEGAAPGLASALVSGLWQPALAGFERVALHRLCWVVAKT